MLPASPDSFVRPVLCYRVLIKYCVLSKKFGNFATSPSLALGCYWLCKNYQQIWVTVHSHCIYGFEGLTAREGLQWIVENTIFTEHPVIDVESIYIPGRRNYEREVCYPLWFRIS